MPARHSEFPTTLGLLPHRLAMLAIATPHGVPLLIAELNEGPKGDLLLFGIVDSLLRLPGPLVANVTKHLREP